MPAVSQVEFSYDAAGLEDAIAEALTWDGVYYVRVWLNEGALNVGDSIMYVLIGADIRPRCVDALQRLVGHIKNDLVVEREVYA
jgi:molybdopterin synthase catalytic subunit